MSEADVIIRKQADLYTRITRVYDNTKKRGTANITLGVLESRLTTLESYWERFESNHESLLALPPGSIPQGEYLTRDVPAMTEESYLEQRGLFLDWIRQVKVDENQTSNALPSPVSGPSSASTAPAAAPAVPRITLPRIQLPHFSGKYEDWPTFRDLFLSIIGHDNNTSQVEKLHYLKTCLKGEAELLIRNLSTTEENYVCAWDTLSVYYENKRLLVRSYLNTFVSFPKIKTESAAEIRKMFHCFKSTASSLQGIGRSLKQSEDLFIYLAVELLDPRSRREWENSVSDSTDPPTYEQLETFLDRRLHTLEAISSSKADNTASSTSVNSTKPSRNHHAHKQLDKSEAKRRCSLCHKDHFLMLCDEYKAKSPQERKEHVHSNKLCFNCLGHHAETECNSKKSCAVCGARHHTSLHDNFRDDKVKKLSFVARSKGVTKVLEDKLKPVLLATARVRVADRHGIWHIVRALVDQGADTSLISEGLVQRLVLPRFSTSLAIFGVGGIRSNAVRGRVEIVINHRTRESPLTVNAIILSQLTIHTGGLHFHKWSWPHLRGLDLADPNFGDSDPIELLLGADVFSVIMMQGFRKGSSHEPIAQNTTLGWILSGSAGETISVCHLSQLRLEEDLAPLVRRFWEQEEVSQPKQFLSKEEQECEVLYTSTHSRRSDGRYVVRLPFLSSSLPDLFGTRRIAERMMKRMEARFALNTKFYKMYADFLHQYEVLGHMTQVTSITDPSPRVCYLPHHGVLREASVSTKLRVVFNGSSILPNGYALNQFLHAGPSLLPALTDIILKWRRHRYVLATDVEKMFRQIEVHPDDRNLQRIIWRKGPGQETKEFQLNTVTYGLACAPFLAIRTLRQLADDEEHRFPLAAQALRDQVYMDDILIGASTHSAALELQRQLIQLCMAGGFPLKKWSANDASLLEEIPVEDRLQQERWWQPGESHATLGLRWQPYEDCFSFTTQQSPVTVISKRTVLSLAAKLFDPLGWLAPVTVRAKIFIQSTWLLSIDWDTPLPEEEAQRWREFQDGIHHLNKIQIPRWLASDAENILQEVHGFSDASERAFAAVVYLRIVKDGDSVEIRLISAKTKVAPLKQVTLPRLELCAATLLVRLVASISQTLNLTQVPLHLWSDSTVALGWIRGHPTSWKTYVANRVSEIQTTLPDAFWHHTPGRDNPADCASRGISPSDLLGHSLWWEGPPWLHERNSSWSSETDFFSVDNLPDQRIRAHVITVSEGKANESPLLKRFSTLNRLIRFTSWCRRWLRVLSRNQSVRSSWFNHAVPYVLQATELAEARLLWIRNVQAAGFKRELETVEKGIQLPSNNKLTNLYPFKDDQGILRVGGRLKHSNLPRDMKHLIILPDDSHFTRLIIEASHKQTLHGGAQLTLCQIRQEFWLPQGRKQVKKWIHRCIPCLRWRAASPQPLMGSLPSPRVRPSRPFLHTGVDYAGPIRIKTSKGRGQRSHKGFIAVFVSFSMRAVHLDAVTDYSADAFLATLRRFLSRRGLCHTLYSDCGTNFVGADHQLRRLFSASSSEGQRIATQVAEERIYWRFNPPAAPNFGGIWEAAVKSLKHHLRRTIGETTLTYEEMATLLTQIEACMNSRPLQAMSDDPEDLIALTPGHFLIGSALIALPEPSLAEESSNPLTRWQLIQKMRDHFWSRWSREYLHTLAHRPKWQKQGEQIRFGQLCLLKNELMSPSKWPLVRVIKLHPGEDDQVRVVDVRTSSTTLTRPVSKLIPLPVESLSEDVDA